MKVGRIADEIFAALKAVLVEYEAVIEGEWGTGRHDPDWAEHSPAAKAAQDLIDRIEANDA